jgi:hypothetical protein
VPKYNVMFFRFPGLQPGGAEHPDTTDWLVQTVIKCKSDERIGSVLNSRLADTPITMTRNRSIEIARQAKADFLCMIDADMAPDMYLGTDPKAYPFWDIAFNFLTKNQAQQPAVIAAPYCGPPPHENVYIFKWANLQSDNPNPDHALTQFTREEAALRYDIEEVAALPTGLILIDMRALDRIDKPYFYYEWEDGSESQKASTEDVTFTRDLSMSGVPIFCAWGAWAGHYKVKKVGRPQLITAAGVSEKYRKARERERLAIMVPPKAAEVKPKRPLEPETVEEVNRGAKERNSRHGARPNSRWNFGPDYSGAADLAPGCVSAGASIATPVQFP